MRTSSLIPPAEKVYGPALLLLTCLVAQLYLVFFKSFNWDEFLHFSFIYELRAGTLNLPFQIFHLRLLWWAPDVASNLLDQMRAARIFMWSASLVTLFMIYGVARQFTTPANAFLASFAYLTAGYVFTQSFSIRADPVVTATLMTALYLFASGQFSVPKALVIGTLVGLAGMMTFKAIFYAPCFAGLAWAKFHERASNREFLCQLAVIFASAILSFTGIYLFEMPGIAESAKPVERTAQLSFYLRWITPDLPFANHIRTELILAPFFFLAVLFSPVALKKANLDRNAKITLVAFLAPLFSLLFYRNTFPYFFVFILAPIAVGITPSLALVRARYGSMILAVVLSAVPLTLAFLEPRHVLREQRALIDYVHQEFPSKSGYLDYSGMISDYPRVLQFLTSGNGMRLYREEGDAVVAREISRGNVPFIIANHYVIRGALEGHPVPGSFLPADLDAMNGNYVRQWGVLWREGTNMPAGGGAFEFHVRRDGMFVLDGNSLAIDGATVRRGDAIALSKGRHLVAGGRGAPTVLWRGDKLPARPPEIPLDRIFTNF